MGCSCGDRCLNKCKYTSGMCYDGGKDNCDLGIVSDGAMMPLNDLLLSMMNRICEGGLNGERGNPGINGTNGTNGINGTNGLDGAPGVCPECVDISVYDSGWKEINDYSVSFGSGFPAYTTSSQKHPFIRIIGKVVYIRGIIYLPLMDSSGNFIPDEVNYESLITDNKLLTNGAGYNLLHTGAGVFGPDTANSINPILPIALIPNYTKTVHQNYILTRSILVGGKNLSMTTSGAIRVLTDGRLNVELQKRTDIYPNENSFDRTSQKSLFITRATQGDYAPDYGNYKTSFTGSTNNMLPVASNIQFPMTIDANEPSNIGGFIFDFNTSWILDENAVQQDIIDAFDSI